MWQQKTGRVEWHVGLNADPGWLEDVLGFANLRQDQIHAKEVLESHSRLNAHLRALTSKSPAVRRKVQRELAKFVSEVPVAGSLNIGADRKLDVKVFLNFKSQEDWYATALCALFQDGLDGRVRRCPECDQFFIDWPRRGGTPKVYCSTLHQDRARKRRERSWQ
jgi:hypothetical protein